MKSQCEVPEGFEIRGFLLRIYPSPEQVELLQSIQEQTRYVWNVIVAESERTRAAQEASAIRRGIVSPRPATPDYKGMAPEVAKAARIAHVTACRERWAAIHQANKGRVETAYRPIRGMCEHFGDRHDYQLFKRILTWRSEEQQARDRILVGASCLQALGRNLMSKGVKRYRRFSSDMPVQVRTGECFELGDFGARRGVAFYNCQVRINGLKIKGRLPGKLPSGRVIEGVAITQRADGWFASIREVVPIRIPAPVVPGTVIGIDVGLHTLAALSDGRLIRNERGKAYARGIAWRQREGLSVGRLQQRAARHVTQQCYELARDLQTCEIVAIEDLNSRIGQMGSDMTSAMRKVKSILQARLGDRVREVPCAYTSQDCSQCGIRSKESWSWEHGRIGKCPACGYSADRDLNAARNIAAKGAALLIC